MSLSIVDHPLAKHLLTQLRDKSTRPDAYRVLTEKLTTILLLEATKHLSTQSTIVETPNETTGGNVLETELVAIPILRAGLGMLDAATRLFPNVSVGFLGLERNEDTAKASTYYSKLPPMTGKVAICLDPMLATGGSAVTAMGAVFEQQPIEAILVTIVSAPEGVAAVHTKYPNLRIVTAALDRGLNQRCYIVPGLGDFGDRLFGTG